MKTLFKIEYKIYKLTEKGKFLRPDDPRIKNEWVLDETLLTAFVDAETPDKAREWFMAGNNAEIVRIEKEGAQ